MAMNSNSLIDWPQIGPSPLSAWAAAMVVDTAISTPKSSRPTEASSSSWTDANGLVGEPLPGRGAG